MSNYMQAKILCVSGLKESVTEEMLKPEFEKFGSIETIKRLKDFAYIHYDECVPAAAALEALNGHSFDGAPCEIFLAQPQEDGRRRDEMKNKHQFRQMAGKGFNSEGGLCGARGSVKSPLGREDGFEQPQGGFDYDNGFGDYGAGACPVYDAQGDYNGDGGGSADLGMGYGIEEFYLGGGMGYRGMMGGGYEGMQSCGNSRLARLHALLEKTASRLSEKLAGSKIADVISQRCCADADPQCSVDNSSMVAAVRDYEMGLVQNFRHSVSGHFVKIVNDPQFVESMTRLSKLLTNRPNRQIDGDLGSGDSENAAVKPPETVEFEVWRPSGRAVKDLRIHAILADEKKLDWLETEIRTLRRVSKQLEETVGQGRDSIRTRTEDLCTIFASSSDSCHRRLIDDDAAAVTPADSNCSQPNRDDLFVILAKLLTSSLAV